MGFKLAVGFLRGDSRGEFHRGGKHFYAMYEEINQIPTLNAKMRLIVSSGRSVPTMFGPNDGPIATPEYGMLIVSKDWIAASTKKQIDARGTGNGNQWWIAEINNFARPIGVCMASGHGGQKILIIPDDDLVVVFTSKVFNRKGYASSEGILISYILPAVDSSLTHNQIVQLPPDRLDQFVGRNRSEALDYEFPLIRQGNHLTLKERFWSNVAIEPVSATRFIGDSKWVGKFSIEFLMNRDGNIDHCLAYLGLRGG